MFNRGSRLVFETMTSKCKSATAQMRLGHQEHVPSRVLTYLTWKRKNHRRKSALKKEICDRSQEGICMYPSMFQLLFLGTS